MSALQKHQNKKRKRKKRNKKKKYPQKKLLKQPDKHTYVAEHHFWIPLKDSEGRQIRLTQLMIPGKESNFYSIQSGDCINAEKTTVSLTFWGYLIAETLEEAIDLTYLKLQRLGKFYLMNNHKVYMYVDSDIGIYRVFSTLEQAIAFGTSLALPELDPAQPDYTGWQYLENGGARLIPHVEIVPTYVDDKSSPLTCSFKTYEEVVV